MPRSEITHVYLVRHGETDWNCEQRLQGALDVPLNDAGTAQAHRLARRFVAIPIAVVISSPLMRASATAAILAAGFLCARRAGVATPAAERWKTALVFWGTFLFFLAVRALNPEIYSGEKPMDFDFLNTLFRATTLPPPGRSSRM